MATQDKHLPKGESTIANNNDSLYFEEVQIENLSEEEETQSRSDLSRLNIEICRDRLCRISTSNEIVPEGKYETPLKTKVGVNTSCHLTDEEETFSAVHCNSVKNSTLSLTGKHWYESFEFSTEESKTVDLGSSSLLENENLISPMSEVCKPLITLPLIKLPMKTSFEMISLSPELKCLMKRNNNFSKEISILTAGEETHLVDNNSNAIMCNTRGSLLVENALHADGLTKRVAINSAIISIPETNNFKSIFASSFSSVMKTSMKTTSIYSDKLVTTFALLKSTCLLNNSVGHNNGHQKIGELCKSYFNMYKNEGVNCNSQHNEQALMEIQVRPIHSKNINIVELEQSNNGEKMNEEKTVPFEIPATSNYNMTSCSKQNNWDGSLNGASNAIPNIFESCDFLELELSSPPRPRDEFISDSVVFAQSILEKDLVENQCLEKEFVGQTCHDEIDRAVDNSIKKYEDFTKDQGVLAIPSTSESSVQTDYCNFVKPSCKRRLQFDEEDFEPINKRDKIKMKETESMIPILFDNDEDFVELSPSDDSEELSLFGNENESVLNWSTKIRSTENPEDDHLVPLPNHHVKTQLLKGPIPCCVTPKKSLLRVGLSRSARLKPLHSRKNC